MATIKNILEGKQRKIISVAPDTFVYSALELMYDKNISALIVMENEKLEGIFTERDYARKVVLKGKSSKETLIKEIMTVDLIVINSEDSIEDAMRIMTEKHIRHLPVTSDNKLIGIISIGDVVKYLIEEQKFIINSMENYIKGS